MVYVPKIPPPPSGPIKLPAIKSAAFVPVETLKELRKFSDAYTWFVLAREWLMTILCLGLVIQFPNPVVWALGFIFLGRQNWSLLVLVHHAAHGQLFRSRKLNDFVGNWLCASPTTFTLSMMAMPHAVHHAIPLQWSGPASLAPSKTVPLQWSDPDAPTIAVYPVSKASFARKLLRDITGITNYRGHIKGNFFNSVSRLKAKEYASLVVMLTLIWSLFYLAGHPWYFLFFWLLPAATMGVVFFRIGTIAQHGGLKPNSDQRFAARTMLSPWNFWFLPHHHNYHIEHHMYPRIPFMNLPKLHKILKEMNVLPAENVCYSYITLIKQVIF